MSNLGSMCNDCLRPPPQRGQGQIIAMAVHSNDVLPSIRESLFPKFNVRTFTFVISMVEVAMFVCTLIVGQLFYGGMFVQTNPMAGPTAACLRAMGGKFTPDICVGRLDRLMTPIILHAGVIHICSNLFFQMHFGFIFEERWTALRFGIVYFVTGVGASLLSAVANADAVSVGASGSLFGIIGANITYLIMNWPKVPGNRRELCCMIMLVLFNFMMGGSSGSSSGRVVEENIDSWAHFGGLLTGILCGAWTCPIDNVMWDMIRIRLFQLVMLLLNIIFFAIMCAMLWVPGAMCSQLSN